MIPVNKNEYLKELKKHLKHINKEEREDILNEYETHFYSGQQEGKSEAQISNELGYPKAIGKELNASVAIEKAHQSNSILNIFSAIVAVMGVSLLNFFVILVPALLLLMVVLTLVIFTLISLVTPIILLVKVFLDGFHSIILYDVYMTGLMFGLGLMLIVVTFYIIKWLYILIVKYLRWNVTIIKS